MKGRAKGSGEAQASRDVEKCQMIFGLDSCKWVRIVIICEQMYVWDSELGKKEMHMSKDYCKEA